MPSRRPATFSIQWYALAYTVGREQQTVHCATNDRAQSKSLVGKWNAYKSALKRGEKTEELTICDGVTCRITDTGVTFFPREEAWDALILGSALAQCGVTDIPKRVEAPPVASTSDMAKALADLGFSSEEKED